LFDVKAGGTYSYHSTEKGCISAAAVSFVLAVLLLQFECRLAAIKA
jgi:hypothetical protein